MCGYRVDIYDGVIHSKTMNLVETSFGVEVTFCHKTKVLICEIVVRCFFVCKMINSGVWIGNWDLQLYWILTIESHVGFVGGALLWWKAWKGNGFLWNEIRSEKQRVKGSGRKSSVTGCKETTFIQGQENFTTILTSTKIKFTLCWAFLPSLWH